MDGLTGVAGDGVVLHSCLGRAGTFEVVGDGAGRGDSAAAPAAGRGESGRERLSESTRGAQAQNDLPVAIDAPHAKKGTCEDHLNMHKEKNEVDP